MGGGRVGRLDGLGGRVGWTGRTHEQIRLVDTQGRAVGRTVGDRLANDPAGGQDQPHSDGSGGKADVRTDGRARWTSNSLNKPSFYTTKVTGVSNSLDTFGHTMKPGISNRTPCHFWSGCQIMVVFAWRNSSSLQHCVTYPSACAKSFESHGTI